MNEELLDLINRDEAKMPYLTTGTVLINYNPLRPASVMVRLSGRMEGLNITAWARVAMPRTGAGFGTYALPDIGDEVVCAFCDGEIDSPVIIGSLYNLTTPPPPEGLNPLNTTVMTKSRIGHTLKMDDIMGVELTSMLKQGLKIDDKLTQVKLQDPTGVNAVTISGMAGSVQLTGLREISLQAGACVIKVDAAGQSVSIAAPKVDISGLQSVSIQGMQVSIKGQMVSMEGAAQAEVKSAGITALKGSMVKIN